MYKKKLIEVALPLDAINAESAREKSIRHGHPSTLHLWWARRPLAAARAIIWASLVDDPSSKPEEFPTEEEQIVERERLFKILEKLVVWENSNNEEVLNKAKEEILKSTNGNPPPLLDPFAGGGAIPLEAQRLGLEAHASDLNPVAVMINKAMIEIPPKFANQPPVNPEARTKLINENWTGIKGLAEDIRYYGEWMRQEAFKRIGYLYPTVKDENGEDRMVIAWIWARTVKCPNPACVCQIPLVNNFRLSRKKGREAFVQPIVERNKNGSSITYKVKSGKGQVKGTIINRRGARCICCEGVVGFEYIREEARNNRMGSELIAIATEGYRRRDYFSPCVLNNTWKDLDTPDNAPDSEIPEKALGINIRSYGFEKHKHLFTKRQLITLSTFIELLEIVREKSIDAGASEEYAQAIVVYLAFLIDKLADLGNALNRWEPGAECPRQLFARQAIPMVWDYAEANPFSNSSGSWNVLLKNLIHSFSSGLFDFKRDLHGHAIQQDAQVDNGFRDIMVSTDPPYYDNIGYGDLSDFFYVWLRLSLKNIYPNLFKTMLVPKMEELIANPFRFHGNKEKAKDFFESGMMLTFKQIKEYTRFDIPVTVYYAFKQNEKISGGTDEDSASTGWETMLTAIISGGFAITGTWPIRTECGGRMRSLDSNALASSIVLVCRKRQEDAPICTRRDFINVLKRELKPALDKLQASNIAPVDMAQSAIGPGMAVYSRYSKVLEANGEAMTVRSALQIINQELDLYFSDQDGELDSDSRFCVDLYTQYAFNEIRFGEADVLARAKNTSVEGLVVNGVLHAQKGVVRLLTREELPIKVDRKTIWLLTQQLTHALEKDGIAGAAKIVAGLYTSEPERARALAYRLYTIAERKGWASEAYAYNSLVTTWRDIQAQAAELQAKFRRAEQGKLFDQ